MFILIHSPLVGSLTWQPVAEILRQHGYAAIVPALSNDPKAQMPYWRQHASSIAAAVVRATENEGRTLPKGGSKQPIILVGHSGAGMLLPAVRQALEQAVTGYIFVDAGIPHDGKSRFDLFDAGAEEFRQAAVDGFLPTWTDEDLREAIPDDATRRVFVAELQPMPLAVYEEPIPVFAGWPDAPCAYLGFSASTAYAASIAYADQNNWQRLELPGAHFEMLLNPQAVTDALLALAAQMTNFNGEVS